MMGSSESMRYMEVRSCITIVEMITVKMGAEDLMISAKETGMYQSAISASETVKNLKAPIRANLKKCTNSCVK